MREEREEVGERERNSETEIYKREGGVGVSLE